jgi:RND family efflux transporter MFP subunit
MSLKNSSNSVSPSFSVAYAKELLQHRAVQVALGVIAVAIAGGLSYYLIESTPPRVAFAVATTGNIVQDVTATGVVSPLQNPTLSFETGGQVRAVHAVAGQKVSAGAFLASLDTGVLSASLEAAQAKLNELEVGPRSVDLASQQTSVASAQASLANTYANYPNILSSTFSKDEGAVSTDADPLFDISYRTQPALTFSTVNSSNKIIADEDRANLINVFAKWQADVAAAGTVPSAATLQSLTIESQTNLNLTLTFLNDLLTALNDAQVGPSFTRAQQTSDIAAVNNARDTVNGLITSLTVANQSITTSQLALQSAQDQLNQTTAGAASQDIDAQRAQVAGIEAQIGQQEIIAPFSGSIASVSIKSGDVVSANTPAISLIPGGTFELDVYLAENDVAKVKAGDVADVTLDAYGASRYFSATVGSVDASPSINPNVPGGTTGGYKVTLVFANADPAIANGMHANAVIHAGSAQNVLTVPKGAVIIEGTQDYVLKQSKNSLVKTSVTTGLSSNDSVEIVSGLVAGDVVSAVGAQ